MRVVKLTMHFIVYFDGMLDSITTTIKADAEKNLMTIAKDTMIILNIGFMNWCKILYMKKTMGLIIMIIKDSLILKTWHFISHL